MKDNRRDFIKKIATISVAASVAKPALSWEPPALKPFKEDPKGALRIGYIGCSRKGETNMRQFQPLGQKPAGFCDVDTGERVRKSIATVWGNTNAEIYTDYRKFLEKKHKEMDAVVVSTPDVSHFGASMLALEYGLPVFVEKPMCHSIGQIRALKQKAKEKNLVTQMGNQSHSKDGIHICKAWMNAGLIGKIKEIVIWTDRPFMGGTAVIRRIRNLKGNVPTLPIPADLNWDAWHATTPVGPYKQFMHPGSWRVWWNYGSGALGDIGCHMLDIPVFGLDLPMPSRVKSRQFGGTPINCAQQEVVEYYFDKTSQGVPLKITWHSGIVPSSVYSKYEDYDVSMRPKLPEEYLKTGRTSDQLSSNGMFIIGDEGVIYSPTMHLTGTPVLLPKEKYNDLKSSGKLPEQTVKYENGDHYLNFVKAIRGEEIASSNFDYAGKLTEIVQLGNLSLRSNSDIIWDAEKMICKGNDLATSIVNEPLRKDWY